MKKSIIVALAALTVLALAGVGLAMNKSDNPKPADHAANGTASDNPEQHSNADRQQPDAKPIETNKIDIKDFAFVPAKVTVKKGTTVTWTNQDTIRHDIKPDSESESFKASKLLAKGESYSWTFDTVGTYTYHCSPHPYMKATIEVVE